MLGVGKQHYPYVCSIPFYTGQHVLGCEIILCLSSDIFCSYLFCEFFYMVVARGLPVLHEWLFW